MASGNQPSEPASGGTRHSVPAVGDLAGTTRNTKVSVGEAAPPIDRELLAIYFAPNPAPFLATFDKMRAANPWLKKQVVSWSWPAFLVTLRWFLYRKRWMEAAVVTLLPLVLFYLIPSANSGGVAFAVVIGMYAKSWYVMFAASRIRTIQQEEPDPQGAREKIARAGGVSVPGAIIGGVIFAAAFAAARLAALTQSIPHHRSALRAPRSSRGRLSP
jgi:hypothetical protein